MPIVHDVWLVDENGVEIAPSEWDTRPNPDGTVTVRARLSGGIPQMGVDFHGDCRYLRVDSEGYAQLSDCDVERIAQACLAAFKEDRCG